MIHNYKFAGHSMNNKRTLPVVKYMALMKRIQKDEHLGNREILKHNNNNIIIEEHIQIKTQQDKTCHILKLCRVYKHTRQDTHKHTRLSIRRERKRTPSGHGPD